MLQSASELFRERGIAGTALADVIERSQASRGSIYHFFPDGKAQLAEEATAQAGRLMGTMITELVTAQGPIAAINTFLDFFRRQMIDTDFEAGCPVAAAAMESGEALGARSMAGESFAAWESALSTALWQHGVARERAASMATLSIAAIEGALMLARGQRDLGPLDRVAKELTNYAATVLAD